MFEKLSKVYSLEYITFLIIFTALLIFLLIIIKKRLYKKLDLIIVIGSIVWLIFGILNRVSEVYTHIYTLGEKEYSWMMLIPFTICSTLSIVFPIVLIITKGNTKWLHYLIYAGITGSIITFAYPGWIAKRPSFWNIEVVFGLLHHWMMLFMCLLLLVSKKFKPKVKMTYVYFLGYAFMMIYGLILYTTIFKGIDSLNIMNINKPLIEFLPNLTSWWGFGLMSGLLLIIFIFIYERISKKITIKEFLCEIFWIKNKKDKDKNKVNNKQ